MGIREWWLLVLVQQLIDMAARSCLPVVLLMISWLSPCQALGDDSDTSESHKKVVIHVPSYEKVIKHTHTVYKIIGGKKEDNDHKHKGEVIHKHIHGGHVDHVHKHDGHGSHDHKHHGHAEHGHTHHGHNDHKHAHALHGVHDHKHSGHAEHGHKHTGQAQHGHTHGGQFQGSHKHTGHSDHDHKHYGQHDHKHGHHVHSGSGGSHGEFNSRAFQSLAPASAPSHLAAVQPSPLKQYETYEYLDDIPQLQGRGVQTYYADPFHGYSRTGRAAHHFPNLGADSYPQGFRFDRNPFPYNSETYSRYFRNT